MESGREVVANCIFSKRWQLSVALNALPQPCHLPSRVESLSPHLEFRWGFGAALKDPRGHQFQGQIIKGQAFSSCMRYMAISEREPHSWIPAAATVRKPEPHGEATCRCSCWEHHWGPSQLPDMWASLQLILAPSLGATVADAKWSRDKLSPSITAQILDLCAKYFHSFKPLRGLLLSNR